MSIYILSDNKNIDFLKISIIIETEVLFMEKINLNIQIGFKLYNEMCKICESLNITIDEFVEMALISEINNMKNN